MGIKGKAVYISGRGWLGCFLSYNWIAFMVPYTHKDNADYIIVSHMRHIFKGQSYFVKDKSQVKKLIKNSFSPKYQ